MVYFQIIIGGITRLTGSGLSITKWEIVTGTLPPFTEAKWIEEFDKYKATPQYEKINEGMLLGSSIFDGGSFKFIYFWEYFHRLWARSMGFVFLIPFIFFWRMGWLSKVLRRDLGVVVALAGLAAIFGWIMVASGLVNRPWVNAYKLAIHLSIGVSVFSYLLWTTLKYKYREVRFMSELSVSTKWISLILILSGIQLFFGGIMSGMKASLIYPTWPDIGGHVIPPIVFDNAHWSLDSFIQYDRDSFVFAVMHTIHRNLAYLIVVALVVYFIRKGINRDTGMVKYSLFFTLGLVTLQIVLGIITVLQSKGAVPVLWGVLHQGMAVLFFGSLLLHYFIVKHARNLNSSI